jgi:hypothetical protein
LKGLTRAASPLRLSSPAGERENLDGPWSLLERVVHPDLLAWGFHRQTPRVQHPAQCQFGRKSPPSSRSDPQPAERDAATLVSTDRASNKWVACS